MFHLSQKSRIKVPIQSSKLGDEKPHGHPMDIPPGPGSNEWKKGTKKRLALPLVQLNFRGNLM